MQAGARMLFIKVLQATTNSLPILVTRHVVATSSQSKGVSSLDLGGSVNGGSVHC